MSKDSGALSHYVDYEALRTDLKGDMRRSMMSEMGKQPDNPFGAIGMAIAMNLIDPMIEAMVTPEGVEAMFAQQRAAESNGTGVVRAAGSGQTPRTRGLVAAGPGDDPEVERVGVRRISRTRQKQGRRPRSSAATASAEIVPVRTYKPLALPQKQSPSFNIFH